MGDAAARTDRLVVDLLAGGLVVVRGPLGDDRIDERRTGTGDVGGLRVEGEAEHHGGDSCVRSEEHTSELQSLMRISYAVFCLKKKTQTIIDNTEATTHTPTETHSK